METPVERYWRNVMFGNPAITERVYENANVTIGNLGEIIAVDDTSVPPSVAGKYQVAPVQTADFTAEVGWLYPVDTTGGVVTVSPPANRPPWPGGVGDYFYVVDATNNSSVNNILIDFTSGQWLFGNSYMYPINVDGDGVQFVARYSTTWYPMMYRSK